MDRALQAAADKVLRERGMPRGKLDMYYRKKMYEAQTAGDVARVQSLKTMHRLVTDRRPPHMCQPGPTSPCSRGGVVQASGGFRVYDGVEWLPVP